MNRARWTATILCAVATAQPAGPALAQSGPMPVTSMDAVSDPGGVGHRERALHCMTLAIAYEAGFEPLAGQQAVGEVILNRTRHPAYPKSVCGVVFQGSARRTGCQFTFTCDGAMRRTLSDKVMLAAREAARQVLDGGVIPVVGGATHYHANYVRPYWAPSLIRIGQIGAHIFYRAPGSVDGPARYVATPEPGPESLIAGLDPWTKAPDPLTQGTRAGSGPSLPGSPAAASPPVFAPWGLAVR